MEEKKKKRSVEIEEVLGECPLKRTIRDDGADVVQQMKTRLRAPPIALRLVLPQKSIPVGAVYISLEVTRPLSFFARERYQSL
jgi:hypothetical protein